MIKTKLFILYMLWKSIACPCRRDVDANHQVNGFKIKQIGHLDALINESSGLIKHPWKETWLTHNDSGGETELYEIDSTGQWVSTLPMDQSTNNDWEELTSDDSMNLYIADAGNNRNTRRDLCIYKFHLNSGQNTRIDFTYADQHAFPPHKDSLNYDMEAFYWHKDSLFLFSKDVQERWTKVYGLDDHTPMQTAQILDSLNIHGRVTGAALDSTHRVAALLCYGRVYFLDVRKFPFKIISCQRFTGNKQAEAIAYKGNGLWIISNEQGYLYELRPKKVNTRRKAK